ncbi:unnamed protein product, partial [Polarella glacialis]
MAQPGGQRRHLGQRRLPGELQGPFEREKQLLEGYGHLRFGGGHLPPGPAAAAAAATARCDEMHQFEALQQRCLELEGLVGQLKLKRTGQPNSHEPPPRDTPSPSSPLPSSMRQDVQQAQEAAKAAALAEDMLVRTLSRAEAAESRNEVLLQELAAATKRLLDSE